MADEIDTGFDDVLAGEVYVHPDVSNVPVQPPAEENLIAAPEVTAAVTKHAAIEATKVLVQLPPSLDYPTLSRLARTIAMDIKERHVILNEFGLTVIQYEFLESSNDFYKAALAAACKEWHAPLTTQERIKVEAAAILEDSLVGLGTRMQSKAEGLPGVIEAAKLFAKIADVGERQGSNAAPGERFTINIDLGGDQKIAVTSSPAPQIASDSDGDR